MSRHTAIAIWLIVVLLGVDLGLRLWDRYEDRPVAVAIVSTDAALPVDVQHFSANQGEFPTYEQAGWLPIGPLLVENADGEIEPITVPVRVRNSVSLNQPIRVEVTGGFLDVFVTN